MRYRAFATVVGGKYLGEVEADSEEEAVDKAWELDECHISLCHHCSRQLENAQITDIDIEPVEENE